MALAPKKITSLTAASGVLPDDLVVLQTDENGTLSATAEQMHEMQAAALLDVSGNETLLVSTLDGVRRMTVEQIIDAVPSGGEGGPAYDDTAIKQRVSAVESAVSGKADATATSQALSGKASNDSVDTQKTRIDGIVGTDGNGGRLKTVETSLASKVGFDASKNITVNYVFAGGLSDDGNGNYVPDSGGLCIGGLKGVRYRQEGFIRDYDEGSIASYPNVANRPNRLALCPSGDPVNMPGEDTASFALQHLNGVYEQRFCLISKKAGEYRLAAVATGPGLYFPITIAPGLTRTARFEIDGTTTFTAEKLNGAANTNTVVSVKNPATSQFMRLFGRTNGQFGIEYVSSAGNMEYRVNNVGIAVGAADATRRFHAAVADNTGSYYSLASSGSYTGWGYVADVSRSADSSFAYFVARSVALSGTPDIEFSLRGDGSGFCDGTWVANGADYAEYFEWLDGNPDAADRTGLTVVLEGDRIRPAKAGEDPFGVVSAAPSIIGNAAWNTWNGKYERDAFGRIIKDSDGNPVVDDLYDPDKDYVPREQRPAWSPVGFMGRLRIHKGQATGSRWIKLKDVTFAVEEWLVR